MHQLDRTLGELGASNEYEFANEEEWSPEMSGEAVFDEVQEMELAAELLEISNEEEMEQFLGNLIKSAGKAIGGFVKSPVGQALGGVLKNVAKTALPMAGAALGNMVLPGVGGMIGGKLASAAGQVFGLELEGMSAQDQEFEVARRFVRLAGESVRHAAQSPAAGSPVNAAKDAVLAAAQVHAPGLFSGIGGSGSQGRCGCGRRSRATGGYTGAQGGGIGVGNGRGGGFGGAGFGGSTGFGAQAQGGQSGRWIRRGGSIVLFGA